jgi:hypothetical protein
LKGEQSAAGAEAAGVLDGADCGSGQIPASGKTTAAAVEPPEIPAIPFDPEVERMASDILSELSELERVVPVVAADEGNDSDALQLEQARALKRQQRREERCAAQPTGLFCFCSM